MNGDSEHAVPDTEPLMGDGVTPGIVRIGDTVRRPVRPFTATVHAYLVHLHTAGFSGAPVPLGFDEEGREILSYVPGNVPREPLPQEAAGEAVLAALARLIRRLHQAALSWSPPSGAVWGGNSNASDGTELVGHRDYCPGNVVFRDGLPVALIDFDLARPTTRLYEIANALYWWAPLLDPRDRAPSLEHADIPRRVGVFAAAYGMSMKQRTELVPFAAQLIRRYHRSARAAAQTDPVFRRLWDDGVKDRMPRAEVWIAQEGPAITALLSAPGPASRRRGPDAG